MRKEKKEYIHEMFLRYKDFTKFSTVLFDRCLCFITWFKSNTILKQTTLADNMSKDIRKKDWKFLSVNKQR